MNTARIRVLGALAGTIVGSLLTQFLQRRNSTIARLHEARIDAYRTFAVSAMDFRAAQMERWFARSAGNADLVGNQVYSNRSRTWAAYYQIVLLAHQPEVVKRAEEARDLISSLKDATSREELNSLGEACREAVGRFADTARREVAASLRA